MKQALPIAVTIFGILFLLAPDVQQAVVMLILAGIIPGTNFSVPPLLMLGLLIIALIIVVHWTHRQEFHIQATADQSTTPKKKKASPSKNKARRKNTTRSKRKVATEQTA